MKQSTISYQTQPAIHGFQGEIPIPGDKSISHRALLFSAIAEGKSEIHGLLTGEDCLATLAALRDMGVMISESTSDKITVQGVGLNGLQKPKKPIDCGNSGTSIRLFAGLLAGQKFDSVLTGDTSLQKRPMRRITDPLQEMDARVTTQDGFPPITIQGDCSLQGIEYTLPMPSAQVKSCLLLAGLQARGKTIIHQPIVCRDHTERMLQAFTYPIQYDEHYIAVEGGYPLQATEIFVPADISSAAFFIVAACLIPQSEIILPAIGINPTRIGIINLLQAMGADIILENTRFLQREPIADIRVRHSQLHGITIPESQIALAIDEFPILFIAAACAKGTTILRGASELKVKESDRIQMMVRGLQTLGIRAEALEDGAIIEGGIIEGGEVMSDGDHRIAMSFIVAGLVAKQSIIIRDCKNIATSFPNFIELMQRAKMSVGEV